jgi:hypothetical protein
MLLPFRFKNILKRKVYVIKRQIWKLLNPSQLHLPPEPKPEEGMALLLDLITSEKYRKETWRSFGQAL